ncbi:UAA transporter, partial [Rhizopus azygosporus]
MASLKTNNSSNPLLESSMVWLSLYFFLNLGLTIYNKVIMAMFQFPFPWALTAIHTLCGTIGSYIFWKLDIFKPAKLGERENMVMLMFSVLYTINIAISNVSLNLVTVPFHQVVRAMTPVFTVMLNVLFLKKTYSAMTYTSLIPVIAGVAFATF